MQNLVVANPEWCAPQVSHVALETQNLGFANPAGVSTIGFAYRSGNAKPRFRQLVLQGLDLVLGLENLGFANPEWVSTIGLGSRSGNAKPRFRQTRTSVYHRVRMPFWECKTYVSPT
jgi:hypothetical protein